MEQIKAFIVDDEEVGLLATEWNLSHYCPEVEIVGKFSSPSQAFIAAKVNPPSLVFLDINMTEMSGIELAKRFNSLQIRTIFISSYSQFALEALKINALDFIVKPIDPKELIRIINKVKSSFTTKAEKMMAIFEDVASLHHEKRNLNRHVALPTLSEISIEEVGNIIFCEGVGNYTKFHFKGGREIVLSKTLSLIEKQLEETQFARVHNKYLVNISYISRMIRKGGAGILIMENETRIPISKPKRKELLSKISIL